MAVLQQAGRIALAQAIASQTIDIVGKRLPPWS